MRLCARQWKFSGRLPIFPRVIDTEEKLRKVTPILDEMVQQGLVVLSNVDIIKYTHDYVAGERRKEQRV